MAQESSFDIVSKVDLQEVDNAVNQVKKMILTRYDLKGSRCKIDFDKKEYRIQLTADDHMKYEALLGILKERLAARNVSLKSLKMGAQNTMMDGSLQQTIEFQMGIPADKAKDITKMIRDSALKVQAQIQADQIRVSGRSKDDLQQVIAILRQKDLSLPLQFVNFK